MDLNEHIITFSRWLHIIGASTWLGGTLIYSLILNPLRKINISYQNLFSEIDIRYREIMNISVIILVISGVIITFERITGNPPPSLWFIFLSIKVSLAVIIMFLSWRLRKNTTTKNNKLDNFLGYNIILFFGAIIFLIASYLSTILENSLYLFNNSNLNYSKVLL